MFSGVGLKVPPSLENPSVLGGLHVIRLLYLVVIFPSFFTLLP